MTIPKTRPLVEVLKRPATYGIVKAGAFQREGVLMVRGGDVQPGRILRNMPRVSYAKSQEFSRTVLQEGDVVVALVGYPGNSAVVPAELAGANISRAVGLLRPGPLVEPSFLAHFLNSPTGRSEFLKPSAGSAQLVVNLSDLNKLQLPLPPRDAQVAIAAVLTECDDWISAVERKICKKQAIKQGMMQQLLTGRTRLPGFNESWTDSTLGALARVTGGGTPSTRVLAYWGGGIPWFTPAEIRAGGSGLVSRSERTITSEGLTSSSATLLPAGSVLVTSRASIGNCAVAQIPVTTNQGFTSMIPNDRRSMWFLYYWTQQNKAAFESRAAGSTFLEISASKVAAIPLRRPGLDEQHAIGESLRDVDLELDALSKRLAKARAVKAGVIQELLTGHTRRSLEAAAL